MEEPLGEVSPERLMRSIRSLSNLISIVCGTVIELKQSLERMQEILKSIASTLSDLSSVDMKLDLPTDDIHDFISVVSESRLLIIASLREGRVVPAQKMKELEDSMLKFYLVDMRRLVVAKMMALQLDAKPSEMSKEIIQNSEGPATVSSQLDKSPVSWVDRLRVAEEESLRAIVVGSQQPILELRALLIEECGSPLVISAPPGYGKTTLARKVCEDTAIKDKYGDHIFFLYVSATPNVPAIISKLCEDINYRQCDKIPSGISEIRDIEKFIKKTEISDILLVLDDVWCEWEFLIDEFDFQIPGYKLLVTSRFRFSRFDGYELTRMCQNEGQPLYFQSGKDQLDPNNHHVTEVVPLPFKLPVLMWKRTRKKNPPEGKPTYVANLEEMTKSFVRLDMLEMDDIDAYMLPSRITDGSSTSSGPA